MGLRDCVFTPSLLGCLLSHCFLCLFPVFFRAFFFVFLTLFFLGMSTAIAKLFYKAFNADFDLQTL